MLLQVAQMKQMRFFFFSRVECGELKNVSLHGDVWLIGRWTVGKRGRSRRQKSASCFAMTGDIFYG